ncbi:hypothetical protein G4X40_18705 [Rhodococcus sp. D2-41]|nr:hypothetical protein [Rhodococcus sp. D2-41]
MAEVLGISKSERNTQQNFNFRGIDATMNTVGPALREHGVVIIPEALSIESERYPTKAGGQMRNATVHMRYTVFGPAGDSFAGSTYGEAADAGDKAVSKAQSVAYRTFLLQGLTVPTQEPDPDADTHERAAKSPADEAREALLATLKFKGIDPAEAVETFRNDGNGELRDSTDVDAIRKMTEFYRGQS